MSTEKSKNVVITKKARENLVKARAGAITLPKIIGMLDLGETEDTIAEKTGFSKKTIRHRLNIAKLDSKTLMELHIQHGQR